MKKLLFCTLCVLGIASFAFPGIVSVKNISFTLPGSGIYENGYFKMISGGTANIQTYNAAQGEYEYAVDNLTFDFSPCQLIDDRSTTGASGRVIGDFAGGGVVTLSGDLRETSGSTILHSGKILEAAMVVSVSETWVLQQQNAFVAQLTAALDMVPVDGGLNTGITVGSDTLRIGDISLGLSFFIPTTIEDFQSNNTIVLTAPNPLLSAAMVPEPATLGLLGLGICFMRRKK